MFCNITCICGHEGELDTFSRTEINGELPPGSFQCPKCSWAWKIEHGKIQIKDGRVASYPNKIVPVQPKL